MDSEKYIGLDVHQATIVVAVTDSTGRLVMESILETEAATILQFFAGLRGTLSVTFEEGTWSAWLYDLLNPHVDQECKKSLPGRSNTRIVWGVLGYFFDACRTGRVTAFASDLHVTRSGIAARFTTVFFATFHHTGAGNVGTSVLLRCCHSFCSIHRQCHYTARER
ncbi:MAG: hypothetical protein WBW24_12350 [Candidatus Sulfotelmatobacter sp.]|jgi:hypothetical protein